MEYLAQRECGLDGSIAELLGFASLSGLMLFFPRSDCLLRDPEEYFSSIHQRLVIFFPISYLVLLLTLLFPSLFLLSW